MEQSKTKEQGRRSSKERGLELQMSKNKLVRSQENLCRSVGIWFMTPWPCTFSKKDSRAGSEKSKQMPNQGVAKGIFHI